MHRQGISELLSNFLRLNYFYRIDSWNRRRRIEEGMRNTKRFHEIIYLKIFFPRVVSSFTTIKHIYNVLWNVPAFLCKVIVQMTCNIFPSYDVVSWIIEQYNYCFAVVQLANINQSCFLSSFARIERYHLNGLVARIVQQGSLFRCQHHQLSKTVYEAYYSNRNLISSRIIESAAYWFEI